MEYDLTAPIATAVIIRDIVAEESKINPENPVQVYPNPVTDQLIIDLGDLNGNTLEIYNLLGQPMKKNVLKGQIATVDVNDIPPGIYLLRINTSDGIIIKQIHVE